MKVETKYYSAQKVTEITYNGKVREVLIPTQLGTPEISIVSIFSLRKKGWELRLRTTDRLMPDRMEFIKSLGRSLK